MDTQSSRREDDMTGSKGLARRPRRRKPPLWTNRRITLLTRRWSQGASARQISGELGKGISRDSVLGKIRRLGIFDLSPQGGGRVKRAAATEAPPESEHRAANISSVIYMPRQYKPPDWVVNAIPYVDDPLVDADIPPSQRRSFLQLNHRTCRWPVGDPSSPDFFFCGAEPFQNKPYCEAHCARADRPAKPAVQRAPSTRLRRAMVKFCGIDTYINLGGETAVDIKLEEESR
jgi:GcrA cell cycle regulator